MLKVSMKKQKLLVWPVRSNLLEISKACHQISYKAQKLDKKKPHYLFKE
ncbi:MAG: hypothetical protein ACI8R1_000754 [Psychrobacter glaciei]|jgi:hypothetical protein